MTKRQIETLHSSGKFSGNTGIPELVETHISWVFLCDSFVYKIKKPIHYSFLDFSTIEKRKYYCEREIELNRRLTDDMYIDVQPVVENKGIFSIGNGKGAVLDHAVKMRKLDGDKQMNKLLQKDKVTKTDIQNLAVKIASFHANTDIICEKDIFDIHKKFIDLSSEKDYLRSTLEINSSYMIDRAIEVSGKINEKHKELLAERLHAGFYRDGHGDLHSRNIFLLPDPLPFDCIEFNDDFRQIDVLNEIAFLCMDLDAYERSDLSDLFLDRYNNLFPSIKTEEENKLFIYYKSYRANIRAKVNSLRSRDARDDAEKNSILSEVNKYLLLMNHYIEKLA
jgi:aminoglycoside phosphotransferase family enzyme